MEVEGAEVEAAARGTRVYTYFCSQRHCCDGEVGNRPGDGGLRGVPPSRGLNDAEVDSRAAHAIRSAPRPLTVDNIGGVRDELR